MRYDKIVSFWQETDPNAFNFDSRVDTKLADKYANITDMGAKKQVEILGSLEDGVKIIRLQHEFPKKWNYLMIDGDLKRYRLKKSLNTLKGSAMIVGVDHG